MSFQPTNKAAARHFRGKEKLLTAAILFITVIITGIWWLRYNNVNTIGRAAAPVVQGPVLPPAIPAEAKPAKPAVPGAAAPAAIFTHPYFKQSAALLPGHDADTIVMGRDILNTGDTGHTDAPVSSLKSFFAQTTKASQYFTIDAGQPQVITAAEGTCITIPEGAFINSRGKPVTGALQLEVKEVYKYDDMITAGLTTMCNGQMLVSGGMIYTNATQNGEVLKMAGGKELGITMPAAEFDKDMQLFTPAATYRETATRNDQVLYDRVYGEQSMNWQPAGQAQWQPVFSKVVFTPHDGRTNIFSFTDEPYKTKITSRGLKAWFAISAKAPMTVQEAEAAIKKNFIGYTSVKVKRSKREDAYKPYFLSGVRYVVTGDSTRMTVPDAVRWRYIKPADSMAFEQKRRNDSLQFMYSQAYEFYQRQTNGSFYLKDQDRYKNYEEWYIRFKEDMAAEARELEQKKAYTFATGKLGWINCDRFYKNYNERSDFLVQLPDSVSSRSFSAFLVFKDIRSIYGDGWCNGSQIKFPYLPAGMEVYFVAVGVVGGRMHAIIERTKTGGQPLRVTRMRPLTPQEFKKEMAELTGAAG